MDLERYLAGILTDEDTGVFGGGYGGPDPDQLFNTPDLSQFNTPGDMAVPLGGWGHQRMMDKKYAERLRGLMGQGASAAGAFGNTVLDTSLRDVGDAIGDVTLRGVGNFGKNALSWAGKGIGKGFAAQAALPLGALSKAREALKNLKLQKTKVGVLPDGSRATYDDGSPITQTQDISFRSPFQNPFVSGPPMMSQPPKPATPISYDDEEWGF